MFTPPDKFHINFSMERAPNGSIIRSTILANIYESDLQTAVDLYRQLKAQLEDNQGIAPMDGNKQTEVMDFPTCPLHKVQMVLRTRRDGSGLFFGCPQYSQGCKKTLPYPVSPKENIVMSS